MIHPGSQAKVEGNGQKTLEMKIARGQQTEVEALGRIGKVHECNRLV